MESSGAALPKAVRRTLEPGDAGGCLFTAAPALGYTIDKRVFSATFCGFSQKFIVQYVGIVSTNQPDIGSRGGGSDGLPISFLGLCGVRWTLHSFFDTDRGGL